MKITKVLSTSFLAKITIAFSLGNLILPPKVNAADLADPCPSDWSTVADLADYESSVGNCRGTPDEYGVTIYKMGFCETVIGNGGAGTTPDYDSCETVYTNETGEDAEFGEGLTFNLGEYDTTMPSAGTYNYAYIVFGNTFRIKSKMGPFADGTTYYSNGDSPSNTVGNMSTDIDDYATGSAPLNTFDGDANNCDASWDSTELNLDAHLLSSTDGSILASTTGAGVCSTHNKIFGIAETSFTITSSTSSLTATFDVSNNGTTFFMSGDGVPTSDSGPLNITFTVD